MKNKLLMIGVLILLIGGVVGYKMWNKPHMDVAAADSFITLPANELLKAFQDNEAAANEKFLNKVVTIIGKIADIKKEQNETALHLETGDMMAVVICNLDPFSTHERSDFTVGEDIKLKGVCSGMLTDVVLDRCVLIK